MLKQHFMKYINDNFQKINLNRPYHYFSDVTIIKNFDPNLLSVDKISYKNTDAIVYNIKYIMMESINNQNMNSENLLCLVFSNVNAYIIEECNRNKYLIFALTKNNKKVLGNYRKRSNEIKNQIETVNGGESIKYKKDSMKIRFDSIDDLPLGKILSIPVLSIVVKSVFQNENKYYPPIHIHECEYECEYEL